LSIVPPRRQARLAARAKSDVELILVSRAVRGPIGHHESPDSQGLRRPNSTSSRRLSRGFRADQPLASGGWPWISSHPGRL